MRHHLEIAGDAATVARLGAATVVEAARVAIAARGRFVLALSGGRTPWVMIAELAAADLEWERAILFQVDERVAPDGDPDRNLTRLRELLGLLPAEIVPMPVTEADLEAAAAGYAARLPARFDLVHLGLGSDGHTASLIPGDPVLEVRDRLVGLTSPYQGRRRMTLTYPALARADRLLWLVTGCDKRDALARLLVADPGIPAGRVEATSSLILADRAAA